MSTSMDGEDDVNSQDELSEIEARLYSIVHYNDLSKPLDESIASQYDIEVTADQQIIVTLKGQPDEGGEASEAKRQKLSELGGSGDCATDQKNNQSSAQSDGILGEIDKDKITSQTKTLGDIDKGDGDVLVLTVEESEGLDNTSETNPPKPDERSNHQRFDPAVDNSVSNKGNESFNGGVSPGKKKKIKKRGRKKDNEWVVDLTSDNEDSDCLVVSDEKKGNVEDDGLVLNVLGDVEIENENSLPTTNKTEEKIVEGEKSAGRVDVSGKTVANGSVERERLKSNKKQRRSRIKMKRKSFNCPKTWTASMVKFYCKTSKLRENFNHDTLLVKMRASNIPRDKWVVSKVDKRPPNNRLSHTRCDRCRQFGHVSRFCIEPVKPIICYMCGGHGHRESRCPERKCLNCGRESDIYVEMCAECHCAISEGILYCAICNSLTHHTNLCPNLWRAFHMTTTSGPLMVPHTDMSRRKLHCSNCASEGHMFHECRNTFHVTPFALCAVSPVVPDYSRIAQHFAQLRGDQHLCIALQLRNDQYQRLAAAEGCSFLQELSDTENVTLRMQEQSLTIEGEHEAYYPVCRAVAMFLAQGNCETVSLLE